jgi:hypothetical protein
VAIAQQQMTDLTAGAARQLGDVGQREAARLRRLAHQVMTYGFQVVIDIGDDNDDDDDDDVYQVANEVVRLRRRVVTTESN